MLPSSSQRELTDLVRRCYDSEGHPESLLALARKEIRLPQGNPQWSRAFYELLFCLLGGSLFLIVLFRSLPEVLPALLLTHICLFATALLFKRREYAQWFFSEEALWEPFGTAFSLIEHALSTELSRTAEETAFILERWHRSGIVLTREQYQPLEELQQTADLWVDTLLPLAFRHLNTAIRVADTEQITQLTNLLRRLLAVHCQLTGLLPDLATGIPLAGHTVLTQLIRWTSALREIECSLNDLLSTHPSS